MIYSKYAVMYYEPMQHHKNKQEVQRVCLKPFLLGPLLLYTDLLHFFFLFLFFWGGGGGRGVDQDDTGIEYLPCSFGPQSQLAL